MLYSCMQCSCFDALLSMSSHILACSSAAAENSPEHGSEAPDLQHSQAMYATHSKDGDRIAALMSPVQHFRQTDPYSEDAAPSPASMAPRPQPCSTEAFASRPSTAADKDMAECSQCSDQQEHRRETGAEQGLPQDKERQQQAGRVKKHAKKQSTKQPKKQGKREPTKRPPLVMSKCYADVVTCGHQDEEDSVSIRLAVAHFIACCGSSSAASISWHFMLNPSMLHHQHDKESMPTGSLIVCACPQRLSVCDQSPKI